jgi:hypothetical protein
MIEGVTLPLPQGRNLTLRFGNRPATLLAPVTARLKIPSSQGGNPHVRQSEGIFQMGCWPTYGDGMDDGEGVF